MNIRTLSMMGILLFFFGGAVAATGFQSTATGQMFNGRMWQLLNRSQKEIHVTGIQEGVMLCLSQFKEDLHISKGLMRAMKEEGVVDRRRLLFSSLGVSAVVAGIDTFFADEANLAVPIAAAYQHVTLELNYAPREDLETNLLQLRRKYHPD